MWEFRERTFWSIGEWVFPETREQVTHRWIKDATYGIPTFTDE